MVAASPDVSRFAKVPLIAADPETQFAPEHDRQEGY